MQIRHLWSRRLKRPPAQRICSSTMNRSVQNPGIQVTPVRGRDSRSLIPITTTRVVQKISRRAGTRHISLSIRSNRPSVLRQSKNCVADHAVRNFPHMETGSDFEESPAESYRARSSRARLYLKSRTLSITPSSTSITRGPRIHFAVQTIFRPPPRPASGIFIPDENLPFTCWSEIDVDVAERFADVEHIFPMSAIATDVSVVFTVILIPLGFGNLYPLKVYPKIEECLKFF